MVRVRKIALMGFPAVGKSSLAYRFVEHKFEEEYVTTIENRLVKNIELGGRDFELHIFDTMGVTENPNFPDDYLIMDGWVIVFSIADSRSFDVVQEIHDRLVAAGTQTPTVVIVGNKSDLEADRQVSKEHALKVAKSLGALYIEASAKEDKGVQDIFRTVVGEIERRNGEPLKDKDCAIL